MSVLLLYSFAYCILCFGDEITEGFSFSSPEFEGKSKWKVEGDRIQFLENDRIEIVPLRAVVVTEDDKIYRIFSDWAYFNRRTQSVNSDARVEVLQGSSKLYGDGFIWDPKEKKMTIFRHVDLTLEMKHTEGFFTT